eukprot:14616-Heterococcus_DN1.PRE.8
MAARSSQRAFTQIQAVSVLQQLEDSGGHCRRVMRCSSHRLPPGSGYDFIVVERVLQSEDNVRKLNQECFRTGTRRKRDSQ